MLSNPLLDYGVFNLQAMDLIKHLLFQSSALEGDSERHRFYTRLDRCVLQGLSRRGSGADSEGDWRSWDMAHRKTERNPLFAGRWFEDDIILLCLRWYFRFKLSYRDLVAILGERGLSISHTTILRWVIRYAETCGKRWSRFERQVGGSWRVDETFIKVRGQLMYLYRAVDGQGNTVEFFLSRTRGIAAAKAFFRKALKHHREPHSITLDGHRPSHSALRRMGMNGEFNFRGPNPVRIRCCQYLNNVVEQDHRRVKGRLRPMLGFKTFYNARRVIIGIELAQKIHKRQLAIPIALQSNPAVTWRHVMAA